LYFYLELQIRDKLGLKVGLLLELVAARGDGLYLHARVVGLNHGTVLFVRGGVLPS
jgi:hypothetical protein